MNKYDRKNIISPFHSLLAVIFAFPIFGAKAVVLVPILIIASLYHYWMVAKEDNITIREAFKKDMPDINLFHVFMFLLILFPLWYPFVSANFFDDTPVKKENLLKEEFLKKREDKFFKNNFLSSDLFYNISTFHRETKDILKAIEKSDTLESYLKEIGYEMVVISSEQLEKLKEEIKEFRHASSTSTKNGVVTSDKQVYYSPTKIYINNDYLEDLRVRFRELKGII